MSQSSADYNLRIVWPLARWLEDVDRRGALACVLDGTGVTAASIDSCEWVTAEVFETILARARARMPDDETFMRACTHRMKQAVGPGRLMRWTSSPAAAYARAIPLHRKLSRVGRLTAVVQGPTHGHIRVDPVGLSISRLTCLARQAALRALPTLWGLPEGCVTEDACIGEGDATCEIHVRWYAARSLLPVAAGALISGIVGVALSRAGVASIAVPWFLGMIGGAIGYLSEVRRSDQVNHAAHEEIMSALRHLPERMEARREARHHDRRQREWTRFFEETGDEVTETREPGTEDLGRERVNRVLGFSHDLRNPLQIIQFGVEVLGARCKADDYVTGIVRDIDQAVGQMKKMLAGMVTLASAHRRVTVPFAPRTIKVRELTEPLERRVRALVHGRDIRGTVVGTPEAPDEIEFDPLLLHRITDNLLTNAAKYTERGTITVELDGVPGFLVIRISDTGCGIPPETIEQVFEPGGSSPEARRGDSFGVGLSVVVQLLDQVGGRLEVMSRPNEGTTFWVHLPVKPVGRDPVSGEIERATGAPPSRRVVHVRKLTA